MLTCVGLRTRGEELVAGEEILPGYRVVCRLMRGERVDTYDVYSEERDCRCVVKVVRTDRAAEPRVRAATLLEGRLLSTLSHPHLVRAYETVEEPRPAIVLETLPGATLAALVDDQPLDLGDLVRMGLQLVSVLGYLHRHGWLHLDVKPDNVVVSGGRAVLIDLGLATRPGPGRPGAGTPGYLAPEQDRGVALCPSADVWALGVTLAECATGRLPHADDPSSGCRGLRRRLLQRPLPPADLTEVPAPLRRLVAECLAPDPGARPPLDSVRARLRALA